jgi:hypothetical protein
MLLLSRVKCFLSGSTSDCGAELGEAAQQRVHADGWIRNLKLRFCVVLVFSVSWASLVPEVGDYVSRYGAMINQLEEVSNGILT